MHKGCEASSHPQEISNKYPRNILLETDEAQAGLLFWLFSKTETNFLSGYDVYTTYPARRQGEQRRRLRLNFALVVGCVGAAAASNLPFIDSFLRPRRYETELVQALTLAWVSYFLASPAMHAPMGESTSYLMISVATCWTYDAKKRTPQRRIILCLRCCPWWASKS